MLAWPVRAYQANACACIGCLCCARRPTLSEGDASLTVPTMEPGTYPASYVKLSPPFSCLTVEVALTLPTVLHSFHFATSDSFSKTCRMTSIL